MQKVLHNWLYDSLRKTTDQEFLRWSVICVGSKAKKRGISEYRNTGIQVHDYMDMPHAAWKMLLICNVLKYHESSKICGTAGCSVWQGSASPAV